MLEREVGGVLLGVSGSRGTRESKMKKEIVNMEIDVFIEIS